jgi:hypothetical protein
VFNPMKLFDSPAREIKRLNKDAPNIVEYALQCFRREVIRGVANNTRQHLERVHAHYPGNLDGWKQAVADYERMHREARSKRDDVTLTAFTFVLIYIRAEVQGEACRPARDVIDAFIDEWAGPAEE